MSRYDTGFTLLEVLVALALSALVSVILLHGIRIATTGFERHTQVTERLDARQSLDDLLRHTLGTATQVPRIAGGEFNGTPFAVAFLGVAEYGGPGLYGIDISLDRSHNLVLRRRLAAPAGDPHAATSVIASRVRNFRLAYFGADAANATPTWHDSWQHLNLLPLMMRVTLETENDAPRPPLVVRLWSGGSG